jgi:hypothetical protein
MFSDQSSSFKMTIAAIESLSRYVSPINPGKEVSLFAIQKISVWINNVFNADPDLGFHLNADPETESQTNEDPSGS